MYYLIHDKDAYKKWSKGNTLEDIEDGEYLEFFRVIPTFSDRKAFYQAVLDTEGKFEKTTKSLVMKCRLFYTAMMQQLD